MGVRTLGLFVILTTVALAGCSKKDVAQEARDAEAQAAAQVPAGPATMSSDPGDSAMATTDGSAAAATDNLGAQGGPARLPAAASDPSSGPPPPAPPPLTTWARRAVRRSCRSPTSMPAP